MTSIDQTFVEDVANPSSAVAAGTDMSRAKQLQVLYALGPGDVVQGYRDLLQETEAPFEMSISFLKTFLDWCHRADVQAHMISWNTRRDAMAHGPYLLENLPRSPMYYEAGSRYHIGTAVYGLKIIARALRGRPDVVVVDSGTTHWILLSVLPIFRIPVVAVMHSTLWPKGSPYTRRIDRIINALDGLFFRRFAAATVCVSPECERQVRKVAGTTKGPVYQCRAQFDPVFMAAVQPVPDTRTGPLRVLFVGRMTENKGILLIVSLAERLEKEMPGRFLWKMIGGGPDWEALVREVAERNLGHVIDVTGRLPREEVLAAHGWSHAMIVPTMGDYKEGLAMTAAEAVLAGRPVILSEMVPAWEVLGDAAVRVETGNLNAFVEAFRRIVLDPAYYEHCRRATKDVQDQFYETSLGLGAVVGAAIMQLRDGSEPPANFEQATPTGSPC